MTAYGAVVSLKNTIEFLHSSHFTLVGRSQEIIQLAYKKLQPLQEILECLDSTSKSRSRKKVNALDGRIKEILWEFEDLLECLLTDEILSQSENQLNNPFLFSINLMRLEDDVGSFIHTLKDMGRKYIYELSHMAEDDESIPIPFPSMTHLGSKSKSKMTGLSDQFQQLKTHLMAIYLSKCVYGLVGTAGVGKTTLAKGIFEDEEILSHFECRIWVPVGRKPQPMSKLSRGIWIWKREFEEQEMLHCVG